MGRPVNPRFLGDPNDPDAVGFQITANVDVGAGEEGGIILRQRSNNKYLVEGKESGNKLVCKLVNGVPAAVGEMSVSVFNNLRVLQEEQDETDFDGDEDRGTFTAGSGYSVSDDITLSNGAVVTVGAVDGGGEVTEFSVTNIGDSFEAGTTLTQDSVDPAGGTGFELTPDDDNVARAAIAYARNINNRTVKTFDGDVLSWPKGTGATRRTKVDLLGR